MKEVMSQNDKSTFGRFFKEDAEPIQEVLKGELNNQIVEKVGTAKKKVFPKIGKADEVSETDVLAYWNNLRTFFRNDKNTVGISEDLTPVILSPLFTKSVVGSDFPVWVADENTNGMDDYCLSLSTVLQNSLHEVAPEENEAKILKDNLERLIHIVNNLLVNHQEQFFPSIIKKAIQELVSELDVTGSELDSFNEDLIEFENALPSNGVLLPYSSHGVFDILEAAMFAAHNEKRKKLNQKVRRLKSRLGEILRVEKENRPNKQNSNDLHDSLNFAETLVNLDELSAILPESGSQSIGTERIKRISEVLRNLESAKAILDQQAFMVIDEFLEKRKNIAWNNLFPNIETQVYKKGTGSKTITRIFKKNIVAWEKLFVSIRVGELEFKNNYQPEIHDEYFQHFTWRNMSDKELDNCPYFMLIADDMQLFETEFSKLSAAIDNNIPVKVVAIRSDNSRNESEVPDLHTQAELGRLMFSHKNIFVTQTTSITPINVFNRFIEGLTAFAPALFNILNIDENAHNNPYLWTSSSVESRDFPGFTYTGLLGKPWGSRFDISKNPQPELEWPVHELDVIDASGEKMKMTFSFTFAELAVLNPLYHYHFMVVEPSFWTDNLIPLTDYMENSTKKNIGKVPFIWMIDKDNELHKVAVSWQIVIATQERLDFWRLLQENCGINNYHVVQAVEKANEVSLASHKLEIEQLKEEQKREIEIIRKEEADRTMENLTSVLLGLDTSQVLSASPIEPEEKTDESPEVVAEKSSEEPSTTEEELVLTSDPYIDTALCTSCNECINKNGKMFKYNADKMAVVADANAGTYLQLVEAAEACPVGIIHPGNPLNPDEPDLDDLIKRAEKYN